MIGRNGADSADECEFLETARVVGVNRSVQDAFHGARSCRSNHRPRAVDHRLVGVLTASVQMYIHLFGNGPRVDRRRDVTVSKENHAWTTSAIDGHW